MRPTISALNAREERAVKWEEVQQKFKDQKELEVEKHTQMLKKEHLIYEVELVTLNTKRYRTLWRDIMMRIKMSEIAEDIEITWRNFDRALDIKDYRISFLMNELAETEEQYQRNTRSYIEIIDQLLKLYREKIKCKEQNYQRTLNKKFVQMDTGIYKICYQQNEIDILLHSIIHGIHKQLEELSNNVKSIALSKSDAFMEDSKDVRRISATQVEKQLQRSWENFRRILSNYQNETKNQRKCYEALKNKDKKDQQVITQQSLRTVSLFEEIRKFREKIMTYDFTAKKEISKILIEHDIFQKAFWTVKNCFLSELTKDKNQLKILSIKYNKTIKHLEHLAIKSKRLLMLMQICRKYETQNEKIIPFVNHTEIESLQTLSSHKIFALLDWNMFPQITEEFQDLTNFWRQFRVLQIITMQLKSERDKLKTEASHLREWISSYIMQKGDLSTLALLFYLPALYVIKFLYYYLYKI